MTRSRATRDKCKFYHVQKSWTSIATDKKQPGHLPLVEQKPPGNLSMVEFTLCQNFFLMFSVLVILCCVCVFSSHPFWTSSSLDVPAGVTQEEGHTGFLIHLPSAVRALIFVARRIQPFLSLVDREVEFLCTNELIVLHPLGIFILVF